MIWLLGFIAFIGYLAFIYLAIGDGSDAGPAFARSHPDGPVRLASVAARLQLQQEASRTALLLERAGRVIG